MASMLDDLMRTIGPRMTEELSQRLETDPGATRAAIEASIPVLLAALARNASNPTGASALEGAIERDHDGSLLDDLSGFLANPERADGGGILRHVFGTHQPAVERGIAAKSGLDVQKIARIFQIAAPLVLAYLSRRRQAQTQAAPVDSSPGGGLGDILAREMGEMMSGRGGGLGDILGGLLRGGHGNSGSSSPGGRPSGDLAQSGIDIITGMFR